MGALALVSRQELIRTLSLRGRRSRNKVSVGEPAEGSFLGNVEFVSTFYYTP